MTVRILLAAAFGIGLMAAAEAAALNFTQGFSYIPTDGVSSYDTLVVYMDSPPPDAFETVPPAFGNFSDEAWSAASVSERNAVAIGVAPVLLMLNFDLTFKGSPHPITFDLAVWDGGIGGVLVDAFRVHLDGLGNFETQSVLLTNINTNAVSITQPPLLVKVDNQTISYGQGLPVYPVSYSGFINGDTPSSLGGTLTFVCQDSNHATVAALDANTPPGTYLVAPSGLLSSYYAISYASGTITITPALLTVIANDVTRPVGATNPPFTARMFGFVNGQDSAVLTGQLTFSTPATESSPAGAYPITPSGLAANNYDIVFLPGTLTIAPPGPSFFSVGLSYLPTSPSGTYDTLDLYMGGPAEDVFADPPMVNFDDATWVGALLEPRHARALGLTPDLLILSFDLHCVGQAHPFSFDFAAWDGGPGGVLVDAFRVTVATDGMITAVPITIDQINTNGNSLTPLVVQADNQTRTYGQTNPVFTCTYTGFTNGDTPAVLSGALNFTFADSNHVALAVLDANTPPGAYFIVPSGLTAANYVITFVPGTLTVGPAPLTVQAHNATRAVGAANPIFTGTITGLQNADYVSATYACAATPASPPGAYPIVPTLVDPNNCLGNYTVSVVNGTLLVMVQSYVLAAEVNAIPGALVDVPINLLALGTENTVSFSLGFDPTRLTYVSNTVGSAILPGSQYIVNTNPVFAGALGLLVGLPADQVFPAGTQQVAVITFRVSPGIYGTTTLPVNFVDQPTVREVVSANAGVLLADFVPGAVKVFVGYEADLMPLPDGDWRVTASDWTYVGRLVAGISTVANGGQFIRSDCAPRSTRGDGRISAIDWVQAGRYVVGLDYPQTIGGPLQPVPESMFPALVRQSTTLRTMKILGGMGQAGTIVQVPVQMIGLGDENTAAFSLTFDPARLDYVSAVEGSGLPSTVQLILNTNHVAGGRVGVLIGASPGQRLGSGTNEVLRVFLRIRGGGTQPDMAVAFSSNPVFQEISSVNAEPLASDFVNGTVVLQNYMHVDYSQFNTAGLKLTMFGIPDRQYQIQTSANLRDWSVWTTVTASPSGLVEAIDAGAKERPVRFYRIAAQ